MKSMMFIGAAMASLVAMSVAQNSGMQHHPHQYHHYQIADPGTFGGPQSYQDFGTLGAVGDLNNQGAFGGGADTSTVDPNCETQDCYAFHAFLWQNGAKTDLGLLPGGTNSFVNWISANGLMTGTADNGQPDPLIGIPFQVRGTFWGHDQVITDIGALPGTYFSSPFAVNNRGEVVGAAMNTIPDLYSLWGVGYQTRAFYWKDGVMQDLGTLGTGTDALAGLINERGQVVGVSYVNSIPTTVCFNSQIGIGFAFTTDSFIWDKKNGMRDIGGLGGSCTLATDLNNRGQIVGSSALTGDSLTHSFVWDAATGVTDLMGASNGSSGLALAINDSGQIAGEVCDAVTCHAALWRKSGGEWQETDLGAGGCPTPRSINASAQVVGADDCGGTPFLSEDGAAIVDLNTLVPSNSGLQLNEVGNINDRGEITINGNDVNNNNHSVVLIPCDENHPGVEGCDYSMIDAETAAARVTSSPALPRPTVSTPSTRSLRMMNRFRGVPQTRVFPPQAPLARSSDDWVADPMLMPYGHHSGYCGTTSSGLTGYCAAYSYSNACAIGRSTACHAGQKAKKAGYYQCSLMQRYYVDLGTSCAF